MTSSLFSLSKSRSSLSLPTLSLSSLDINMNRLSLPLQHRPTAGSHTSHSTAIKAKKSVRFSDMCKVVLIPMRQEYSAAGIFLWWTRRDFSAFRQGYLYEKQNEKTHTPKPSVSIPSTPSPLTPSASPLAPEIRNFLVISDQKDVTSLTHRISNTVNTTDTALSPPVFHIHSSHDLTHFSHDDIFHEVIVDARGQCTCFESSSDSSSDCLCHQISILSTITLVRLKSLSTKITLLINTATLSPQALNQMNEIFLGASDLRVLDEDIWIDFPDPEGDGRQGGRGGEKDEN